MTLYLVLPYGKHAVLLDGKSVGTGESFTLSAGLSTGVHALKVDGRICEGILIKNGTARPAGADFRVLLPAITRLMALESRVQVLEEQARKAEVNWLI